MTRYAVLNLKIGQKTRWGCALLILSVASTLASPASATRCEKGIVSLGDTKYEVLVKLGRPIYAEEREVEKAKRTKSGEMLVEHILYEEWTYDFGPNRFIRKVVFKSGRVVRVEHGGYGVR